MDDAKTELNISSNFIVYIQKLSHILYLWHIPLLPFLIKQIIRFIFGAVIPPSVVIGKNVNLGYNGLGIVIHKKCVIGNNVLIAQQVTLGGRSDSGAPVIGNNVFIGAGAKVLGGVSIGDHVKIGANAVVLKSIPNRCSAVGIPARIIQNVL